MSDQTSGLEEVTLSEVNVDMVDAYKVLGGEWTVNNIIAGLCNDDLDGPNTLQHSDWQALYLQFLQEHVLGTIPYRWEAKCYDWDRQSGAVSYDEAQLLSVRFRNLSVVVLDGKMFYDGSVGGVEKAGVVKRLLGITDNAPLMNSLGRLGKAAVVRETAEEWELLVPHCLLRELVVEESVVARFKRHPRVPVTHKWCEGGGGLGWKEWEEGMRLECVPDLDTSWINVANQKLSCDENG